MSGDETTAGTMGINAVMGSGRYIPWPREGEDDREDGLIDGGGERGQL